MSDTRGGAVRKLYDALLAALPDRLAIQLLFYRNYGRFADLSAPRSLAEKINWRKLHQRDPRFTLFSDKLAVKAEVAGLIGAEHVIPTLWQGERPQDIPYERLTPPYVIKVAHGYGSNILVRRPEDVDRASIAAKLRRSLREPHGRLTRQWGYLGVPRRILIERMLDIFGKGVPEDYKVFVYHGRARFIQVNVDRWTRDLFAYYDRDWNRLDTGPSPYAVESPVARPPRLEEMIRLAEKVGALFDFVRVDLYDEGGRVYFGEATFYPSAGFSEVDGPAGLLLGEPWRLPPPYGAAPTSR